MTALSIYLQTYFSAEGVFDNRSLKLVPPIAASMFMYLHGRWFTPITDHKPLTAIFHSKWYQLQDGE